MMTAGNTQSEVDTMASRCEGAERDEPEVRERERERERGSGGGDGSRRVHDRIETGARWAASDHERVPRRRRRQTQTRKRMRRGVNVIIDVIVVVMMNEP